MLEATPSFNLSTADQLLNTILLQIRNDKLNELPVCDRCAAIYSIKTSIDCRSPKNGEDSFEASNKPLAPGAFIPELNALVTLCRSLQFSPAWTRHCENASLKFGQKLATQNAGLRAHWPNMDADQRLSSLKDIARLQCRLFRMSNMDFEPPEINLKEMPKGMNGGFTFISGVAPEKDATSLSFNENWLENAPLDEALTVLWHEQLHSLHFQLGHAAYHNLLPSGHEFRQDADMMKEKIIHQASVSQRYGTAVYRADVEENLCFKTQNSFLESYKGFCGDYLGSILRAPAKPGP